MKKIVFGLFALTLTISSIAQSTDKNPSQQKDFRKEHRGFKTEANYEKLNLTEEQKNKIKTINENFRQQMKDLNKQGSITVDEQRARRKQLAKDHREKIEAILTPEQRKQAESFAENFGGNRHDGAARFEQLSKNLNLTPEQTSKITALNSDLKNQLQSVKQNNALSSEQKKEQLKTLRKKYRSEMEALLSAEQKEQLKKNFKNRGERQAVK